MANRPHDDSLTRQLHWLMVFRVATNTFLLGTTVVVQFREAGHISDSSLIPLYGLVVCVYILTFIYALLLPYLLREIFQAYVQITGDIIINTAVIYLTGGLESAFSFLYILTIINAGVLLKIRGAVMAASISAILYGGLLDLHYYRYIHPFLTKFSHLERVRAIDIISIILVNMGAFYLVAYLSGYLARQSEESRRKLAASQSDLERLTDLNENIIQSIDSGLMTLGDKGEVLSFNPAAERITGLRFDAIKGRSYMDIFPGLDLPPSLTDQPGPGAAWTWTFRRGNDQALYLELGLVGLKDSTGRDWGRLLVFQDKTRMRQMEVEVKRIENLAAIGELAARIAHEIRNPLASMSGCFQMLQAELKQNAEMNRLLSIIQREMDRLNRTVNDFLLYARPRSTAPVSIDLGRVVEDIMAVLEHQTGLDQKLLISKNLLPETFILFDQHQLEQVIWNLLKNAVEAMPDGGFLTVSVSRTEALAQSGVLSVADTGAGIYPENLLRIYDPFFSTKSGGHGLGLSIVARLLEEGGGRIMVSSQPGLGTTFTVYLPLAG